MWSLDFVRSLFSQPCKSSSYTYMNHQLKLNKLLSDDSGSLESFFQIFLPVTSFLITLLFELVHVFKDSITSDDFEADIDVQEDTLLFHDESCIKARPYLYLVGIEVVSLC
jgi:hypothetical protein